MEGLVRGENICQRFEVTKGTRIKERRWSILSCHTELAGEMILLLPLKATEQHHYGFQNGGEASCQFPFKNTLNTLSDTSGGFRFLETERIKR